MAAIVCVTLLIQLAALALSSMDRKSILLIAGMAVNALTIIAYCFIVDPNTLSDHLIDACHKQSTTHRGSKKTRLYIGQMVVGVLAVVYLYFVGQGIYDLSVEGFKSGFMTWVILMLNISTVAMLGLDCRIRWRHQQLLQRVHEHQEEHPVESFRSGSGAWAQTTQEDGLPPYSSGSRGTEESETGVNQVQVQSVGSEAGQNRTRGPGSPSPPPPEYAA